MVGGGIRNPEEGREGRGGRGAEVEEILIQYVIKDEVHLPFLAPTDGNVKLV